MAIALKAEIKGLDTRARRLGSVVREYRKTVAKRVLRYWGDQIRSGIRRDRSLFRYRIAPIRGGGRRRGMLKQSLFRSRPREMPGHVVQVDLGWGVPYGPVLEWGPERAKVWTIKPVGFRAGVTLGRSGAAQAIKFLRFRGAGGGIVYARQVTHKWKQNQLRPHFEPHTEFRFKMMVRDLTRQYMAIDG